MISTFLGARQDPTPSPRQSFCHYLQSEIENLEERDFLTIRNETVKRLSEIQYKAEERKRQVTKSQEVTTYQLPEDHRPQQDVNTYHTGNSTSLHSSCAAYTGSHRRTCYSDCQSSTTTKAFISVSTANILHSCGRPTAWDFQTDDFQLTFSCTFTTGGKSTQHFWIIQSFCSHSQCAYISADGHTTAIFTLST